MAGPIARRPAGLLDLLLTQQQGRNPNQFGDQLLPTIDLTDFYNQERLETNLLSVVATGVNSFTSATIPKGESWRLLSWSSRGAFATVNQQIKVGFRIQNFVGAAVVDLPTPHDAGASAVGANDLWNIAPIIPFSIIYPSGTRFITYTQSLTLDAQPNITMNTALLYVRTDT